MTVPSPESASDAEQVREPVRGVPLRHLPILAHERSRVRRVGSPTNLSGAALRVALVLCIAVVVTVTVTSRTDDPVREVTPSAGSRAPVGPIGNLDAVRPVEGGVEVAGWAITTDRAGPPLWIEVSASGTVLERFRPEQRRFDVEAAYGRLGDASGFQRTTTVPEGVATVCVDAVKDGSDILVRLGCGAADPDAAAAARARLTDLVRGLGTSAEAELPGTRVALAVIPFDTGEISSWRASRLFISASAAKSWWTAAALAADRSADAAAFAAAVFENSSDEAAGSMIDLAGGIDAVNDFTLNAGMTDTAAMKWIKGGVVRVSEQFPGPLDGSNYVDAGDAARFFYRLGTNQVLTPDMTDLLAQWMRLSPRDASTANPEASTISDSLPPDAKQLVEQKAGWLRAEDHPVPPHLLAVGIVHPTNGGPSYAIALMSAGGSSRSYRRVIEFFQSASCQIYVRVSEDDSWSCPDW